MTNDCPDILYIATAGAFLDVRHCDPDRIISVADWHPKKKIGGLISISVRIKGVYTYIRGDDDYDDVAVGWEEDKIDWLNFFAGS